MQPNADRNLGEARDPAVPDRPGRPGGGVMRRLASRGGFSLTGFVVAEAVCFGALVTAVLVKAL